MSVDPAANAVTSPVAGFTLATPVFVLLHVPPAVPLLLYVVVVPIHNGDVPVTVPAVTFGLTVNNALLVKTSVQLPVFILYLFVLREILGVVIVKVLVAVPL